MITITICGPAGSGKTRIAEIILTAFLATEFEGALTEISPRGEVITLNRVLPIKKSKTLTSVLK